MHYQEGHNLHRAKIARPVRRCPKPRLYGDGIAKPTILFPEELDNVNYDKVIADYREEASKPQTFNRRK